MKRFAVIGLGTFGFHVARTLFEEGHDVLGIDKDKMKVQKAKEFVSHALMIDATNKENLKTLDLDKMDAVIVSTGGSIDHSILITLYLKELGVENILVKAVNEDHGNILEKIGASDTIFPERDTAIKLAKNLSTPNILDYLPLAEDYAIAEWAPTKEVIGKSLAQSQLRTNYNIHVMAIREVLPGRTVLAPGPDFVIKDSDILIIMGWQKDIEKLKGKT
jgi:trk system potassium uptake protein TrkA